MPPDRPRTPRTLLIPDHLWEAFTTMASQMGTDRDALVSQAMFTLARLNGFLVPADLRAVAAADAAPGSSPTPPSFSSAMGAQNLDVESALLTSHAGTPTSMELPNLTEYGVVRVDGVPTALPTRDSRDAASARVLVLFAEGRELDRVTKDRFIIGRGKHCDLIISSGKVSREHAAIVRNGTEYFIEDLGSSNGTWHDKRRINRRQIQNGDEYYICSEKLSCVFQ
jgi:FHA domain-containing protein